MDNFYLNVIQLVKWGVTNRDVLLLATIRYVRLFAQFFPPDCNSRTLCLTVMSVRRSTAASFFQKRKKVSKSWGAGFVLSLFWLSFFAKSFLIQLRCWSNPQKRWYVLQTPKPLLIKKSEIVSEVAFNIGSSTAKCIRDRSIFS